MEPYPRAIVTLDLPTGTTSRRITITVPLAADADRTEGDLDGTAEDRVLDSMRQTLRKLGTDLDADAAVRVERMDGELSWCRIVRRPRHS